MGIIYIMSSIILFTCFILKYKTDKEVHIIGFLCTSIVLFFCYNTLICFILTFFTIKSKLWILCSINSIISIVLIYFIKKEKRLQKYKLNKIDLWYSIGIICVIIIVSYFNFGFPFNVNYETGDPSLHFLTSIRFAEYESLMPGISEPDEVYGIMETRKPMSYVNSGILMKCLYPNLETFNCYNVFVVFDIFILMLIGISIYNTMAMMAKNEEHRLWAFLISTICVLGYPLNSLLFGFEYLSLGLLIITEIINMVYLNEYKIFDFKYIILFLSLLNFGLFFSYFMFVPFMYSGLWIYFCIRNYNESKKIITKKLIITLGVTLLIPFIFGYIYHLVPEIYSVLIKKLQNYSNIGDYSKYIVESGLSKDGYIYINKYSNIVLLLPLTFYYILKKFIKRGLKEDVFITLTVIILAFFIEILYAGNSFGKVSLYYLMKNYFALWIFLAYFNYKALIEISNKRCWISRVLIILYIVLIISAIMFYTIKIAYTSNNKTEKITSVMEIFIENKSIIQKKDIEYNQDEIDILKYAQKNLSYDSQIEIVTDENAYYWAYALLKYVNKEESDKGQYGGQDELTVKWWCLLEDKINNVDYMIYFYNTDRYDDLKDKLFVNYEIIYENSSGGILKYNI